MTEATPDTYRALRVLKDDQGTRADQPDVRVAVLPTLVRVGRMRPDHLLEREHREERKQAAPPHAAEPAGGENDQHVKRAERQFVGGEVIRRDDEREALSRLRCAAFALFVSGLASARPDRG